MEKFELIVTTAAGVEGVTKQELRALGFPSPKANDGKIVLQGNGYDIARLNMFLRTGERVYIVLKTFVADNFDALFDETKAFDWDNILPFNAKIIVNGKSKQSKLFAISSCQSIIKKAILCKLSLHYKRSAFPENGEKYCIDFFISNDVVTLVLNTSGAGLHKRGYRDLVGEAPIKETLASAMLLLSDFSAERAFCDPFCGSGTIAIEAARMALNIAAGKNREFDYSKWDFLPSDAYSLSLQEARDKEITDKKLRFYAFDIDPKAVSLAMRHAQRAGVSENIHIQAQDVADFKCRFQGGSIVTNPPYGERLLELKEANALYTTLGEVWRKLDDWSIFVITAAPQFEKFFGKKCDKNRKFFNANIECHYYQYFSSRTDKRK